MKNKYFSANESGHNWRLSFKHIIVLWISSAILFGCGNSSSNDENDSITIETLQAAENVADINLTNRERKEILERVKSNTNTYKNFREQHLNYYSYPSMVFNPVPPGVKFDQEVKPLIFSEVKINLPQKKKI